MNQDWHELIQRYIAGTLPEQESLLLQNALKSDAELRMLYLDYINLDVALESQAESRVAVSEILASHVVAEPGGRRRWRFLRPLGVAAALVAAGFAAFGAWRAEVAGIAEVVEIRGARWESSTLPTEPGSRLGKGRWRLAEGLATIRFGRGAEVTLEGPAELELLGEQRCRLHRGSLVAHVPEHARGFSVLTPSVTLIDHGTDFGISTDESGHANVQVMRGEVELRHASGAPPLRLSTREMAAITPQEMLPVMPLDGEPRRPSTSVERAVFTTEISTRSGFGAAAYVSEPRTQRNQSGTLLLLKHCAEPGYGRKVVLRFDLTELHDGGSISEAKLTFNFAPSGYGYASHGDDARIVVYALTQDSADRWNASELNWDTQPAFDPSAGRVDESETIRLGEFIVPRGVQTGSFSIEGPKLVERLNADANRLLTLIIVRENRIEESGGLVLGIAGNQHPTLPPPTLRIR